MLQRLEQASGVGDAGLSTAGISVRNLTKRFGDVTVLDRIDLDITPKSAVALIGANGTGKSTLLKCLVRLTPFSEGSINIFGSDVATLPERDLTRLRARVGFVFQRHNLVPRISALSNVVHGVQSRERGPRTWCQALARNDVRDEAMACLAAVGLADRALQRADSLSGGQSQRVAIARMLMQRPDIVLADEPDASLDPKTGDEVMRMLMELCRRSGRTFVFVSHRLEHALRYSDRIVGLAGGAIALDVAAESADTSQLRAFFSDPLMADSHD